MAKRTKPICFAYCVTGDKYEAMAKASADSLRQFFPKADICLIPDSSIPTEIKEFCESNKAIFRRKFASAASAALARLAIPLMPEFDAYRRVVYLDADTKVVSSDVAELSSISLGDNETGAAPDVMPNRFTRPLLLRKIFNRPVQSTYCNTGVVVFNLAKIAREEWRVRLSTMLEAMKANKECFRYQDQDLLNGFCKVAVLPSRFNCFARWHRDGLVKSPVIIHYAGGNRALYDKLQEG